MLESGSLGLPGDTADVNRRRDLCVRIFSAVATHFECGPDGDRPMTYRARSSTSYGDIMFQACSLCKNYILDEWDITPTRKEVFYIAFVALVSYTFNMYGVVGDNLAPKYFSTSFPFSAMNRVSSFDELVVFFYLRHDRRSAFLPHL